MYFKLTSNKYGWKNTALEHHVSQNAENNLRKEKKKSLRMGNDYRILFSNKSQTPTFENYLL